MRRTNSSPPGTWAAALDANHRFGIVEEIFECFERGDRAGILDRLGADVEWTHAGDPAVLPFAGQFSGREEVSRYLDIVRESVRVTKLSHGEYRFEAGELLVDLEVEGLALPTGKPYRSNTTLIWTINPDFKVVALKQRGDVSALETAFRG